MRGKRCVLLTVEVQPDITAYAVREAVKKLLPCVADATIEADYRTGKKETLMVNDVIVCD